MVARFLKASMESFLSSSVVSVLAWRSKRRTIAKRAHAHAARTAEERIVIMAADPPPMYWHMEQFV